MSIARSLKRQFDFLLSCLPSESVGDVAAFGESSDGVSANVAIVSSSQLFLDLKKNVDVMQSLIQCIPNRNLQITSAQHSALLNLVA